MADTGIGIAPEDQQRIFQDFAQMDNPIQRRVKGTGLGLPLSKKLAICWAAKCGCESQLGIGSTFTAQIPLRYEQHASSAWQLNRPSPRLDADAWSLPVLVLEDKVEMMMMYRSYLKNSGFHLIPASTIREAQEVLERIRPKAIILDVVLRAEDSWRFLVELNRMFALARFPL